MFPIRIIQDKTSPNTKWLIRKENIDTDNKMTYNVVPFHDYLFKNTHDYLLPSKNHIKETLIINKIITKWSTPIISTDLFRKLTPQEYFTLSKLFKNYKLIYNKKTDKLIEI